MTGVERYDARLCARWELPVVASIGGEPVEFARIKAIQETYRTRAESEWSGKDRVVWSAELADKAAPDRSSTVVALADIQPLEPDKFRQRKQDYERRQKAAKPEQDG